MHNRAKTDTANKAAAARRQRKLVRSRSLRRVAFSSLALFALVFTLLSFRLTAGLDPSSSGSTVATTSQPQTSAQTSESAEDDDYSDTQSYIESESDSSSSDDESSSADSTTSTPAPAAPTTRAS